MKRPPILLLPAAILMAAALGASAIAQTAAPPPMPSDPRAVLELASRLDGLHPSTLSPWHVRASFTVLHDKKQVNQGIWEEWWAGKGKYKIHFAASAFDQTRYLTDRGWFAAGSRDEAPDSFYDLSDAILGPLADPSAILEAKLIPKPMRHDNIALECIDRDRGTKPATSFTAVFPLMREYCFIGDLPAVRLANVSGVQMTLNSIVQFQGQYLPRQIRIDTIDGNQLNAQLEIIETIEPQSADFQPPPDAAPFTPVIQLPSDEAEARRISGAEPEYPDPAKAARVQGAVILEAEIGKDGAVDNVRVLKGDLLLQRPAVDAVRTWRFRPWLADGEPVGFRTRVNVVFGLTSGRGALW